MKQNQSLKEQRWTQNFQISNGRLFDVSLSNSKKSLRLCLLKQYRNIALQAFHEDQIAGHLGTTKTLHKLTKRFIWPNMTQQVTHHVLSSQKGQTRSPSSSKPSGLLKSITVDRPFERIGLDLVGPLPKTRLGNKYIISAVDYLTKWTITKSIPNPTT